MFLNHVINYIIDKVSCSLLTGYYWVAFLLVVHQTTNTTQICHTGYLVYIFIYYSNCYKIHSMICIISHILKGIQSYNLQCNIKKCHAFLLISKTQMPFFFQTHIRLHGGFQVPGVFFPILTVHFPNTVHSCFLAFSQANLFKKWFFIFKILFLIFVNQHKQKWFFLALLLWLFFIFIVFTFLSVLHSI